MAEGLKFGGTVVREGHLKRGFASINAKDANGCTGLIGSNSIQITALTACITLKTQTL